jgi:hypothetical protein
MKICHTAGLDVLSSLTDLSFHNWPLRSPDLTPCDFFLWGYVKDVVYVPPLPNDLQELRQRIIAAVATINWDMMQSLDRNGLSD